jgi:hypothetical protein
MHKHAVPPNQLTLHAVLGGPTKAKATALMLADLGLVESHSRPHTSNDNPFSEAHFKTLTYQLECIRPVWPNFSPAEIACRGCAASLLP